MARLAVLASGDGSNFQALAEAIRADRRRGHVCCLLIHDRRAARAAERAAVLGVPARHVTYRGRERGEAEAEISAALAEAGADLIALAGFMRLLSPPFVRAWAGRLVNVHPSLLPDWPGLDAIRRAHEAGARVFGVTVHLVDAGMDTGPILVQEAFTPAAGMRLAEIEGLAHAIEHRIYPAAVLPLLDECDARRSRS